MKKMKHMGQWGLRQSENFDWWPFLSNEKRSNAYYRLQIWMDIADFLFVFISLVMIEMELILPEYG